MRGWRVGQTVLRLGKVISKVTDQGFSECEEKHTLAVPWNGVYTDSIGRTVQDRTVQQVRDTRDASQNAGLVGWLCRHNGPVRKETIRFATRFRI